MKTGSGVNLNFLSNCSQLLLSHISLFTLLLTVLLTVGFFCCCYLAFRLGICFQVDVDIIFPSSLHPPRPAPMISSLATHNSYFNTSDTELFEISARLKLVSVPFSGLLLDFFGV